MPAVEAGRREVGWLVFPSEWRGGVVGLTRGEFRSMVKRLKRLGQRKQCAGN